MRKVVVIGGDGIGPEVIGSAMRLMEAEGVDIEFMPAEMGLDCYRRKGSYLPGETLDLLEQADACLFGAITSPSDPGYRSPLLTLRRDLDLFVNIRPLWRIAPDLGLVDLDIIIFRENTEGMYSGEEVEEGASFILRRRVSESVCRRLVRFSREYAEREGRKKLTCVHKANVIPRSDGLFKRVFFDEMVASSLKADDMLVDACAAAMVSKPSQLDCIVTLNLYGDILSDEGAALAGGMGLSPSANIGDRMAIFEPVHGSAPDIAGRGVANPVAAILSAVMMLRHLGLESDAEYIEGALKKALIDGKRTPDIGGDMGTDSFTDEVIRRLVH